MPSLKQWDVKLKLVLTHSFPAFEVQSLVSEFALSSQWIVVIFPLFWLASVTTFIWFIIMTLYWITLVFSQLEDEKSVLEDSNDQRFTRSSCFALARTCSAREDKSLLLTCVSGVIFVFRHDNQVGRWLTSFRATWDPKFEKYAVVGSMRRPRQVNITINIVWKFKFAVHHISFIDEILLPSMKYSALEGYRNPCFGC